MKQPLDSYSELWKILASVHFSCSTLRYGSLAKQTVANMPPMGSALLDYCYGVFCAFHVLGWLNRSLFCIVHAGVITRPPVSHFDVLQDLSLIHGTYHTGQ